VMTQPGQAPQASNNEQAQVARSTATHSNAPAEPASAAPAKKPRRALYRAARTRVSAAAREGVSDDE
jgi:hypothetical protein